ncbi:MAG: FecR family protein [Bacteroidales bacterium]|nr:FecR family protein [Bacteroidales bacterium]
MQKYNFNKKDDIDCQKEFLDMFLNKRIQVRVPHKTSSKEIWKNLLKRLERQNIKKASHFSKINFTFKYQIAAAASILLLLGTFFIYSLSKTVSYTTQHGQISEFSLPDESQVILNADSKIIYKRNFWNRSREVYLSGEAIFNVKKGNLFSVTTDQGNVNVLGTSFNVFTRGKELKVSCFTGKVLVKLFENDTPILLTRGKETNKTASGILKTPASFDTKKVGSWKNGVFYFTNEDLRKVFNEIERQFKVRIITQNLSKRYYTGSFKKNSLKEALDLVCIPMNLRYSLNDDSIVRIRANK